MQNLGFQFTPDGARFAVHSATAEKIVLCLFENGVETARIPLTPTDNIHSTFVRGLAPGTHYGLRAEGPWTPEQGHCFDPSKLLLDPYATAIDKPFVFDERLAQRGIDTALLVPTAIAVAPLQDLPLRQLAEPGFIYELQVRSFSKLHPDIPEAQRGTIAALAHPAIIAHLKRIGVDTVELMPITAWITERHLAQVGLRNAWGYNPVSFFAPDPNLAPGGLADIRSTIAELHRHGFNVILDMVFNHSGEGDASGPVLSFRGLDNTGYYAQHNGSLDNDTGCGNTFALYREPMMSLVLASLRHWVLQAGVDGFRFDLATVMGRTGKGFSLRAPLLEAIEADPVLSTRIMIAEPWDVGPGGYQLGNFPPRWYEWNDKFRDDVRRFWRGDDFSANTMATRLSGSSDVFPGNTTRTRSVNFIAAHDGFTLRDLTEFRHKDNLANGENNRDGKSDELTCPDAKPAALIGSVLLARGIAQITAGDEFGRTQKGNNNAYAQDNEIIWLDWDNADEGLIDATAAFSSLRKELGIGARFLVPENVQWLTDGNLPIDWSRAENHILILRVHGMPDIVLDQKSGTVSLVQSRKVVGQ